MCAPSSLSRSLGSRLDRDDLGLASSCEARGAASVSLSPFTWRCSSSPSLSFLVPHKLILYCVVTTLVCEGCLDELLLVVGGWWQGFCGKVRYVKEKVQMARTEKLEGEQQCSCRCARLGSSRATIDGWGEHQRHSHVVTLKIRSASPLVELSFAPALVH